MAIKGPDSYQHPASPLRDRARRLFGSLAARATGLWQEARRAPALPLAEELRRSETKYRTYPDPNRETRSPHPSTTATISRRGAVINMREIPQWPNRNYSGITEAVLVHVTNPASGKKMVLATDSRRAVWGTPQADGSVSWYYDVMTEEVPQQWEVGSPLPTESKTPYGGSAHRLFVPPAGEAGDDYRAKGSWHVDAVSVGHGTLYGLLPNIPPGEPIARGIIDPLIDASMQLQVARGEIAPHRAENARQAYMDAA